MTDPSVDALVPMAELLGWQTTASADARRRHWPRSAGARAVIVTSHDVEVAGGALQAALARPDLAYVGAMGSRRTQEARRAWLVEHGVTEDAQSPVHRPAGLDIAADGPPEIALSILAELVSVVRGGHAGSLQDREGPIHPELGPGEAFCPTG